MNDVFPLPGRTPTYVKSPARQPLVHASNSEILTAIRNTVRSFFAAVQVERSVYEYIVNDSDVERRFAKRLNERDDIKLFIKLPGGFEIDTPVGKYNPD